MLAQLAQFSCYLIWIMSNECQEITQHQPEVLSDVDDTEHGALQTTCVAVLDKLPREDLYHPVSSSLDKPSAVPLPVDSTNNATPSSTVHSGSKRSRTTSRTNNSTLNDASGRKNKQSRTVKKKNQENPIPDVYEWVDLTANEVLPTPMPMKFTVPTCQGCMKQTTDYPDWQTSTCSLPGIFDITVRYNPYCLNANYLRHALEDFKYVFLSDHRGPTRRQQPTWMNLYCTECLPLQ